MVSRSAQDGIVLQEYQNFELQVLPLVFLVPNFCPRDVSMRSEKEKGEEVGKEGGAAFMLSESVN